MNSILNFSSRLLLIFVLACAICVSGAEGRARKTSGEARLVVQRAANFGTYYILRVEIDGRTLANVPRGQRFDGFVPAGHHVLTISSYPHSSYRWPTSMHVNLQPGVAYMLTARLEADRLVLR